MDNPEAIINTLDYFGFANIRNLGNEIRCGHDYRRNKTSICVRLKENPYLYVSDFSGDSSGDFFSFIIKAKNTDFRSVIKFVKNELQLSDEYDLQVKRSVFGGVFAQLQKRHNLLNPQQVYDKAILNPYPQVFAKRFLDDNISLTAQNEFDIRYDTESQRILIPIYDSVGELIGLKGRANWEVGADDTKYLYLIPCRCSETLYGYAHNYQNLAGQTVCVCESEKAVMQAWSYGYQNFVGIGGSRVSNCQCKLLVELMPKKIILLPDVGLDMNVTIGNEERLKSYTRLFEINVGHWSYGDGQDPDKASPTDLGYDRLTEIINNEITWG